LLSTTAKEFLMASWQIKNQIHYPLISEIAPAPHGQAIAFCVREPLMTDDRSEFLSHIWLVQNQAGSAIQLTYGDQSEGGIAWSPDGQYLAYTTKRDKQSELRVLRVGGGESWLLAALKETSISAVRWSRDGRNLAFLAAAPPDAERERRQRARDDAYVWEADQYPARLYQVPFRIAPRPLPEPEEITDGSFHVVAFDWLADNEGFAIAAMRAPIADYWPETWLATVRPSGELACAAGQGTPRWATDNRVKLFPTAGGEPRLLANTPDSQPELLGWKPDGSGLFLFEFQETAARQFFLPSDQTAARQLHPPAMFSLAAANQGVLACVIEDFHTPNTIALVDANTSEIVPLYTPPLPADWPSNKLPAAEVIRWQSSDGTNIEGIVTYPLGYQPGQVVPLVVVVHGGPTGVYQRTYLGSPTGYAPICMFAEQGYATLRCNPRGSSGYGRDFRFANDRDWGGGDFRDIMAGVDTLISRGIADREHLAIMGWSYGGFMSSWAITQTDRFRVACIGAPVTDPISFNGTADIPGFVPDYFGAEYWEDHAAYQRQSPLLHVQNVQTPALIQHGAADIRVPLSQGRQFYEALRRRGIPTDFIVYPRQGHLFSEPRLIIDCRERVVAWIGKYL
jgi:dipeptidyl aminopeptidase/acylaminoacyl peptidase